VDRLYFVTANEPVAQLRELMDDLGLAAGSRLFSRCVRCNVELVDVPDRESVRDRVHPNVYARYERFYTCPRCGTVFWKGSHVRNTCAKLGLDFPGEH
jgi:uncharacterized protein with PIN domain